MSLPLTVKGLCKVYPGFTLENVSFSLAPGRVTGFIGRNGAGKSTTLKALLNLVHPAAGEVRFFGLDLAREEYAVKQRIGFAGSAARFYPKKTVGELAAVTAGFYESWDEAAFRRCLDRFALDPAKRIEQLSEGMRVKLDLTVALSHHAELLILDEPTPGRAHLRPGPGLPGRAAGAVPGPAGRGRDPAFLHPHHHGPGKVRRRHSVSAKGTAPFCRGHGGLRRRLPAL